MRLSAQPLLWKWVLFAWEWKVISISKAEHLPSFWNRGPGELGNGVFLHFFFVWTEKYEEELEQLLTTKSADYEKEVCYELTKACEGVDRSKKEKEEMDVRFNDQKQEVKTEKSTPKKDDDGIQRMNIDINDPGAAKRLADQIKMQVAQQQAMGGGSDDDEDDEDEDEEEDEDEDNSSKTKKKTEL